jgi:hypothetical protein
MVDAPFVQAHLAVAEAKCVLTRTSSRSEGLMGQSRNEARQSFSLSLAQKWFAPAGAAGIQLLMPALPQKGEAKRGAPNTDGGRGDRNYMVVKLTADFVRTLNILPRPLTPGLGD